MSTQDLPIMKRYCKAFNGHHVRLIFYLRIVVTLNGGKERKTVVELTKTRIQNEA